MRFHLSHLFLPLLMAASLAAPAVAQERGRGGDDGARARSQNSPEELRARWESLSEKEKARLRERLEQLKKLPPAERDLLRAHTQRFEEMGRRIYRGLSDDTRKRLDGLPAAKRQQLLQEMVAAEVRDMGRRILRKLPEEDRKRIEAATPVERLRMLGEIRMQMDERISQSMERMAPELGFSKHEVERLRTLEPGARRTRFLHMVKSKAMQYVDLNGLPKGVSVDHWKRIRDLPPDEFYLAVLRLRRQYPDLGRTKRSEAGHDREGEAGAVPGKQPDGRSSSKAPWHQRLRRALQVELDPAERLGLAGVSRTEREREIHRRQRERAMKVLDQEGVLLPEERKALAGSSNDKFFARVRRLLDSGGRKVRDLRRYLPRLPNPDRSKRVERPKTPDHPKDGERPKVPDRSKGTERPKGSDHPKAGGPARGRPGGRG